jgi:hypothetical protein
LAYWAWCDTIMCSTGEEEGDEDLLRRRVYSKQKAMNEVDEEEEESEMSVEDDTWCSIFLHCTPQNYNSRSSSALLLSSSRPKATKLRPLGRVLEGEFIILLTARRKGLHFECARGRHRCCHICTSVKRDTKRPKETYK